MKGNLKPFVGMIILIAAMGLFASASYAIPIIHSAHLTGPAENPPNASPGIGDGLVSFDPIAHVLAVSVTFTGLSALRRRSHTSIAAWIPPASPA